MALKRKHIVVTTLTSWKRSLESVEVRPQGPDRTKKSYRSNLLVRKKVIKFETKGKRDSVCYSRRYIVIIHQKWK